MELLQNFSKSQLIYKLPDISGYDLMILMQKEHLYNLQKHADWLPKSTAFKSQVEEMASYST